MQLASSQTILKPFQSQLPHLSLIHVKGTDAIDFLQGQLSIDVTKLIAQQGHLACYLNRKGRIKASLVVYQHENGFYLEVDTSIKDTVMQNLNMYGAFSKVSIEDVSQSFVAYGANQLRNVSPEAQFIRYLPFGIIFWLYRHAQYLEDPSVMLPKEAWQAKLIKSGISHIDGQNIDAFTPYELHYHHLAAISVDKGCYLGQEIIARIHFKGVVKAKLFCLTTDKELHVMSHLKFEKVNATVINTVGLADEYLSLVTCNQNITRFRSCLIEENTFIIRQIDEIVQTDSS